MRYRLVEEKVGKAWLITSPDLPGLRVADVSLETARSHVSEAVFRLEREQGQRETTF